MRLSDILRPAALFAAIVPLTVTAQDQTEDDVFDGEASLNIVATRGNSDTTTTSGELNLLWDRVNRRDRLSLEALNSHRDEETSAERYFVAAQSDFKLDSRRYIFVLGDYEDDRFSGYEYRANAAVGYGYQVIRTDTTLLEFEAGPGYRYSKASEADTDDGGEVTLRAAVRHEWDFSDTAGFRQDLQTVAGDETVVSRYEAAVVADLINSLALKVAYGLRHVSDAPDDVSRTDQQLTVGVVYGF